MNRFNVKTNHCVISPEVKQTILLGKRKNYREVLINFENCNTCIKVFYNSYNGAKSATNNDVLECASLLCDDGLGAEFYHNGVRLNIDL